MSSLHSPFICCSARGGGHSHRLYSHNCESVSGQRSKPFRRVQSMVRVRSEARSLQSTVKVCSEAPRITVKRQIWAGLQVRLKFKGRKSAQLMVKLLKRAGQGLTRGRSCDYRLYGSDPPLQWKKCGQLSRSVAHLSPSHSIIHLFITLNRGKYSIAD